MFFDILTTPNDLYKPGRGIFFDKNLPYPPVGLVKQPPMYYNNKKQEGSL